MGNAVTLFRVAGMPVRVHASWLVIVGLITWSLSVGYFPHVLPDLAPGAYWGVGLVATLLLFASVLLHELAHALVARRLGIPVAGITLHVFGGVSQLEREPDRPGREFAIAVVGPVTSFALAALCAGAAAAVRQAPRVAAVLDYLALVNGVVGLFNLLPGFPLDGGRLLRAVLWKVKGSLAWATRIAAATGSGFAMLLILLGVLRALGGQFLGGLWLVLIGLFLHQAGQVAERQLLIRRALAPLRVADAMTRQVIHVAPALSVARLVDEYFWPHHVSSFPVVDADRVVGVVSVDHAKAVPRERWPDTRVADIMRPFGEGLALRPGDSLADALARLSDNAFGRAVVLEDGRLVGYLSVKDVLHLMGLRRAD